MSQEHRERCHEEPVEKVIVLRVVRDSHRPSSRSRARQPPGPCSTCHANVLDNGTHIFCPCHTACEQAYLARGRRSTGNHEEGLASITTGHDHATSPPPHSLTTQCIDGLEGDVILLIVSSEKDSHRTKVPWHHHRSEGVCLRGHRLDARRPP